MMGNRTTFAQLDGMDDDRMGMKMKILVLTTM